MDKESLIQWKIHGAKTQLAPDIEEVTQVPHKSELKMNSASRERISESNYQT
jgi:hypothetical protein